LESLVQAAPRRGFECLLVLNGRDAECGAVAAAFSGRLPGLRILPGPLPRSLGGARNAALHEARGEWLCFLDDDAFAPPGYFLALSRAIERHPDAAAIGGPNLTPPGSPLFERCCGHLLGSRACAGPMSRRYREDGAEAWTDDRALILCNLAMRRRALLDDGLSFDETLARNEENLLLEQLLARGRRALFVPDLFVHHERRPTPAAFAVQCFLSGRGRAEMTFKRPSSLRALHAAPALLLAGAAGLILKPAWFVLPAAAYAIAAALNAAALAIRRREGPRALAPLFFLMPAAHLSYAAGLIAGTATGLLRPRARRPAPAEAREAAAHAG
jgi:hypothetical protein